MKKFYFRNVTEEQKTEVWKLYHTLKEKGQLEDVIYQDDYITEKYIYQKNKYDILYNVDLGIMSQIIKY